MEDRAHIRVSLSEGVLEVSGSEEFVSRQAERFEELIEEMLRQGHSPTQAPRPDAPDGSTPKTMPATGSDPQGAMHAFPRVFGLRNDETTITASVPGSNKAEKTRNIALLLGLAGHLENDDQVDAKHIRHLCEEHGCFDQSNFKATLKDKKEYFIIEGGAQDYTVRLTVPGRDAARELAESLNEA